MHIMPFSRIMGLFVGELKRILYSQHTVNVYTSKTLDLSVSAKPNMHGAAAYYTT